MNLQQCFDRHKCDRGTRRHNYHRIYEGIQPKRILEVGVFTGAGVAAWLDYCGAEITCIDLFERVAPEQIPVLQKVTWYQGDSRTIKIPGTFDLIIDDGNHTPDAQRLTFQNLWSQCTGRYFIEDVWALDVFTPAQRKHKWIQRPAYSMARYKKLLNTVSAFDLKRHDLRIGAAPDSYMFEISRDA